MSNKGLYANIHAKRKRGEKMRKKGAKGAPTDKDFKNAAKTAKLKKGGKVVRKMGGGMIKKKGYAMGGKVGMRKKGYKRGCKVKK